MTGTARVRPGGPVRARLAAPGSKSVTNRALAIAALAEGTTRLRGALDSDDTRAMRRVATGLGATVVEHDGELAVSGVAGRPVGRGQVIDCALSGTTMRFGTALAALADGPLVLDGAPPLRRRPLAPLIEALRGLGAAVDSAGGFPPVRLAGGGIPGGVVAVDVTGSSQFLSALLLAAPYAHGDVELRPAGAMAAGYVELTLTAMRAAGAEVDEVGGALRVRAGQAYRAGTVTVDGDMSAAAHLLALAVATGGEVAVTNPAEGQPDVAVLEVYEAMGAEVAHAARPGDALLVRGPEVPAPVAVDVAAFPDQVTTIAVLCALAPGRSTITGAAVARGHETDRLAALAAELGKLGVAVAERPDGLDIDGGLRPPPREVVLATYDDHRLAMAFAALAARIGGVAIADPGCVAKTYPRFWDDLQTAGLDVEVG